MTGDRGTRGRRGTWLVALALVSAAGVAPPAALGFEAADSYRKGTVIGSLLVGGGIQNGLEGEGRDLDMRYVTVLPRLTMVPVEPFGPTWLRGTIEVGVEGWFQYFTAPVESTAEGLKAAVRYDVLGLGRFVPYVELLVGAGYKNFRPFENESKYTFVLEAGVGLSYLVTPRVAITGGYRLQHLSNAGGGHRNRGFNSDGGVVGVSFHFP